jgi:DNA-binding NtrC family response regulator
MLRETPMKHQILIVDDEPRVLTGLKRALRKEPYTVLTVTSAAEALAVLAEQPVDVVISDHDMPGMTGTVFLAQVAHLYPDTVRFMLTGKPSLEVAIQALNKGAVRRFFTKPCDEVDLTISIRQSIEQRDLMLEASRLLRKYRSQEARLLEIERQYPDTRTVMRRAPEVIDISDTGGLSYERLIDELRRSYGD